MTRPHIMVEIKRAERRLAQVINEIEQLKAMPEYERDLRFYEELTTLMKEFGYEPKEVIEMLHARGSIGDVRVSADLTMQK
ncbi:hypothetical protein BGP84_12905 [Pseudomonas putida]|uniref:Uncharacterized protein n=1 Tax=Pseudomonas putida TaxID=303 RepID=A0A2S3X4S7_PSEPU|nr:MULTISPECIES: hypothetical protein [Pseudomonas]PTC01456.1 hypothetical protein C9975_02080 [Thalassospira xiamenensis]ELF6204239.1 hypothetical protein [Pseudomonas putida]MBF8803211.1 hypothetical protein [Pseudomonas asiatica]MCE0968682.1 hypothetical protein [Pseudomonas sp. NMI4491_12]MDO1494532.1 hypothetical protein [Pseudomonas putida]